MKKFLYIFIALMMVGSAWAKSVEFRVNMSIKAKKGQFTPGTDAVKLAGNFNGWNNGATPMTDPNNDSIYTATVAIDTFNVGDTLFFKFIKGADQWESDPNREYVVTSAESQVYEAYFDRDSIFTSTKSVAITFSCNMEFEVVSGRFNPATDTLTVRGSFNGWSGTDIMTQSATDPNFYEKTVNYVASLGEVISYKYAYMNSKGVAWEGDPNKTYTISQSDFDNGVAFAERTYNDLTLDNITNNVATVKFVVNVNGAVSSQTGQPFESIQNIVIAGANPPLQWPTGGWPNSDSIAVHYLYNDGTHGDLVAGDSLWSVDLAFPQYSPLRIQYKYGANWGLTTNTGSNDNESSVGTDHFINLTADLKTATVRNQWSVMGDTPLTDVVVTSVKQVDNLVPNVYSLAQNFPNPFNPTTNIRFSVPQSGFVTLKVYNLIGQEVATLLSEQKEAGTYNVDFNASNLSSGIYLYTVKSGSFTATKKMILMK